MTERHEIIDQLAALVDGDKLNWNERNLVRSAVALLLKEAK